MNWRPHNSKRALLLHYYSFIFLIILSKNLYSDSLLQSTIINLNTTTTRTKMAKSLRSKVKQAAGRKRRSDSHYAVAEAARIQRLSDKLLAKSESDKEAKAAEVPVTEEGDDAEMKEGKLIYFDVKGLS